MCLGLLLMVEALQQSLTGITHGCDAEVEAELLRPLAALHFAAASTQASSLLLGNDCCQSGHVTHVYTYACHRVPCSHPKLLLSYKC